MKQITLREFLLAFKPGTKFFSLPAVKDMQTALDNSEKIRPSYYPREVDSVVNSNMVLTLNGFPVVLPLDNIHVYSANYKGLYFIAYLDDKGLEQSVLTYYMEVK